MTIHLQPLQTEFSIVRDTIVKKGQIRTEEWWGSPLPGSSGANPLRNVEHWTLKFEFYAILRGAKCLKLLYAFHVHILSCQKRYK